MNTATPDFQIVTFSNQPMPLIHLTTFIAAPIQRVFDLSRSVRLHKQSMSRQAETVVSTTSNGLMQLNDEVKWKAKHLFKERFLRTKITSFAAPNFFTDEQVEGDFEKLKHEHYFKEVQNGTLMIDQFYFTAPYGFAGGLLSKIFLTNYMKGLLQQRNAEIKKVAEGNQWKQFINL